jgi:malate synthase
MQHGFEVITAYGPWRVDGELAQQMAELMRQHLMNQLATVEARQ